jgi:galactonate dehydratase
MHTVWEFRELLIAGGAQYCRPDVGLAGGPTHVKKIAAVAESFHAGMIPHNFLGPVLTAASVHVMTSIPNFTVQEYSKIDEERAVAFPGTLPREGGYIRVPEGPGLGVSLIETKLAEIGKNRVDPNGLLLRDDGSVAYSV